MILTIGPGGCGFSFLNWSITYLRGADEYKTLDNQYIPVDINPIQGPTAHGFFRDHIRFPNDWNKLDAADQQSVVYLSPTYQYEVDRLVNYKCKKIIFQTGDYRQEYFARFCLATPSFELFELFEQLYEIYGVDVVRQTLLNNVQFFTDYYSIPTNIEDYQFLYFQDLFYNLDLVIESIFNFLNLKIDQQRYDSWQSIYCQWKILNQDSLKKFLSHPVDIDKKTQSLIWKELFKWKNLNYSI